MVSKGFRNVAKPQSVASAVADPRNPAVRDAADSLGPVSSSKHNNGLVYAILRSMNKLGLTRMKHFMPNMVRQAFNINTSAPRPGKDSGF